MRPGYEWLPYKQTGRVRLWEIDKSKQLMQWYHEGDGTKRLVRDQDNKPLPSFRSEQIGEAWLRMHRWGRYILGEEE